MISEHLDYYRGKRVLLTGAGYVGAAIVRLLARVECEIVVLRRPSALVIPQHIGHATLIDRPRGYGERSAWADAVAGVSAIFHLAAQTGGRQAENDWTADYAASVAPLALMLEACRAADSRPAVVFASSATVMGSPARLPASESDPVQPYGVYEIHKLLGESYLRHAVSEGRVRGTALRIPNVYGPGPVASSGERGVLNLIARAAIETGRINVYGDGRMLRDFLFVDDVAAAFLAVPARLDSIKLAAYLLGSGQPITLVDAFRAVAGSVERIAGRPVTISHIAPPAEARPIDFRSFHADASAFRDATGWRRTIDFDTGITRTVQAIHGASAQARSWPQ